MSEHDSDWPNLVPRLDQYSGPWAIVESYANDLLASVRTPELFRAHREEFLAATARRAADPLAYQVSDGVAMVGLRGTVTKYGSSFSGMPMGTIGLRRQLRNAVRDPEVRSVLMVIDSPGGTVAGTGDLADDVRELSRKKPIVAFIEDLAASAAYWVASQATEVVASRNAQVGSIGTYLVVQDSSQLFEEAGVKTHVVRAGTYKGLGSPGTEVTDDQLAELQRVVNGINDGFVSSVARGRGMKKADAGLLATGQLWTASEAYSKGLIDSVGTYSATLRRMQKAGEVGMGGAKVSVTITEADDASAHDEPAATEEAQDMADSQGPATYQQLKDELVGADNDFLCSQLEKSATLEDARSNWMLEQAARLEKLQAEKAEAEERATRKPGVSAIPHSEKPEASKDSSTDPIEAWNEELAQLMSAGLTRKAATRRLVSDQPELHKAYIAAYNASLPRAKAQR